MEVNGHWTHGKNLFNPQDKNDIEELNNIRKKQKHYFTSQGILKQNSYFIAEQVWTRTDPLKLSYAKNNNLTYVVLYNINEANMHNIDKIDYKKLVNTGINIIDMSCIDQVETQKYMHKKGN